MASKRKYRVGRIISLVAAAAVLLAGTAVGARFLIKRGGGDASPSSAPASSEVKLPDPVTVTLGCTGDLLIHDPILSAYKPSGYDFTDMFRYVAGDFAAYDYMVANLEVTLAGPERPYSGYPVFSSPDTLVDAARLSGIDMLLSANNHSYDTGLAGFNRTVEVLNASGLDHIGTRAVGDKPYLVKNIGGITFGLVNYTYETGRAGGAKTLNGIRLAEESAPLINSFTYADLESFYAELSGYVEEMRSAGAEAVILYIHWGDEYRLQPNDWQKKMAIRIADAGVDVIVGGHPHVVEPLEVVTGETGRQAVCLYSMGNAVSNQRKERMDFNTGHTEDGVIFETSFTKNPDGSVVLSAVDIVPTWVWLHTDTSRHYQILPLHPGADWKTEFGLPDATAEAAKASYERTMALVGEGLEQVRTEYRQTDLRNGAAGSTSSAGSATTSEN